jgi:large subunit ribosomal protein L18
MKQAEKNKMKIVRRKQRVRAKVSGSSERPRLSIFKSNRYISAQIIDDVTGKTIAAISSKKLDSSIPLSEQAVLVGKEIAKKAQEKKITKVVFDRGHYLYAGSVQKLADSAREAGLVF